MAGRYKATGCTRFLLFLLIMVPIAYFGGQYLMQNGYIESLTEKVEEIGQKDGASSNSANKGESGNSAGMSDDRLARLIQLQKEKIEEQEQTIFNLKTELQELKERFNATKVEAPEPIPSSPQTKTIKGESLEELLKEAEKSFLKD